MVFEILEEAWTMNDAQRKRMIELCYDAHVEWLKGLSFTASEQPDSEVPCPETPDQVFRRSFQKGYAAALADQAREAGEVMKWESDHQAMKLKELGLDEEFPFGCDSIAVVGEALLGARSRIRASENEREAFLAAIKEVQNIIGIYTSNSGSIGDVFRQAFNVNAQALNLSGTGGECELKARIRAAEAEIEQWKDATSQASTAADLYGQKCGAAEARVKELEAALKQITANQYGHQGIVEDGGGDKELYEYYCSEVSRLKRIAFEALKTEAQLEQKG